MISRRNIRVNVMQTLYAIDNINNEMGQPDRLKLLRNKINDSQNLLAYLIYFVTEIARFAETDAHQKASKHLPTTLDLNINTKISGNELVWKTIENKYFIQVVKHQKFEHLINQDLLKKMYNKLVVSDEYADYIDLQSREKKSEKKILEYILNQLLLPNEDFIQHIEELFINWDDDGELMQTLVMNYFNKPNDFNFANILSDEKRKFSEDLLETVIDKHEHVMELIKPKLKNWDADRIASLDLIILQMGVCEFLFFETIPTKVTINEYIDIAKAYSTVQSGQFVNGLLDNIHKELTAENKIVKKNHKQI
jgi:N utilization substance protein B